MEIGCDEADEDVLTGCPFDVCRNGDADEAAWEKFESGCV